ncbi:MAG: hypothetical protein LUH07_00205 [Lachnospiraceae bacterium]|nr:hypothetical protein [Lachnospiraceae bacterium]
MVQRNLAIPYYDKYHFLELERHHTDANTYRGKFYSLRLSDFPYLFNMKDGIKQEISSNDSDTLMEQTHFYCFTNKRLIVSEYNFFGARIEQLAIYLQKVMFSIYPSKRIEISITPIVIPEYFKKILNRKSISKIQFKVAAPGLKLLKEHGIIGFSDIARNGISPQSEFYIDIEISGGRNKCLELHNIKEVLHNIVNVIKIGNDMDKEQPDGKYNIFRKAKVRAYNPEEGKVLPYDLLDEKLVHNCYVEKISDKTKYVNSEKMFMRIMEAYNSKRDDALAYMEQIEDGQNL